MSQESIEVVLRGYRAFLAGDLVTIADLDRTRIEAEVAGHMNWSTAVAAKSTGRHYVGYDLDPEYVAIAEARVADASPEVGARDAAD